MLIVEGINPLFLWCNVKHRSGIKQRRTSWQDGVLGTNCPIPPKSNWTYKFQVKDQIGTYTYFPSTKIHKAAGGFGGFNVAQRSVISIAYPAPDGEFTLLIGDWYKTNHKVKKSIPLNCFFYMLNCLYYSSKLAQNL